MDLFARMSIYLHIYRKEMRAQRWGQCSPDAFSEALQRLDFKVMRGLNLDRESMESQIREVVGTARHADVALCFMPVMESN